MILKIILKVLQVALILKFALSGCTAQYGEFCRISFTATLDQEPTIKENNYHLQYFKVNDFAIH